MTLHGIEIATITGVTLSDKRFASIVGTSTPGKGIGMNMKEIDEVMRLIREDPKQLHVPENIDAIIAFQREWRQKYEAGEKPPSPAGKKSVKELLSIVIKPGPPEKRRA